MTDSKDNSEGAPVLQGKVAVVTGGGSGIGRAIADTFARHGASIALIDLRRDAAEQVAHSLAAEHGVSVLARGADVANEDDVRAAVAEIVARFGGIDLLVNSAGVTARNPRFGNDEAGDAEDEIDAATRIWHRVIAVNLTGTFLMSVRAVDAMAGRAGAAIINMASVMSFVGRPSSAALPFDPYPVSKGGVLQLTRTMATGLAGRGIRVNCICPGYVETELTRTALADPEGRRNLESLHPLGRIGTAGEIAEAALFLASGASSFMTGSPLIVDGGYLAQ